MYMNVHSITINNQKLEITQMAFKWYKDQEIVAYPYNGTHSAIKRNQRNQLQVHVPT